MVAKPCWLLYSCDCAKRSLILGDEPENSNHITGGTAQHIPGSSTNLQNLAGVLVNGNHGGFLHHKALALGINQNMRGTQVHTQVIGK